METKIIFLILAVVAVSCGSPKSNDDNDNNIINNTTPGIIFEKPSRMQAFCLGDTIDIILKFAVPEFKYDSITLSFNNDSTSLKLNSLSVRVPLNTGRVGTQSVRINVYARDTSFSESQIVNCFSDITPVLYKYKILKKYKHDQGDYTQGLIFENGNIYEGTGQKGESVLKKYRLETGELLQSYNIPAEDFGEGIVKHGNSVFQLTWQSGVAYKYDAETFKMTNKFVVQTEGWGITNYNGNLIMSDGSNLLYVLSAESFDVIKRIEVFDNVGPVGQLNELEYIDGKVFANVYMTDFIVIIDPESGRVEGKIDLSGLIDQCDNKEDAEVLNGIAWKGEKNKILVTGKWWSNMFYIEYVK